MKKTKISIAALYAALAMITPTISHANGFEAAVISAKPLGATPTLYYSLPFEDLLKLAIQDRDEQRSPGSKTKPSHLDPYLIGVKNVPGVTDGYYGKNGVPQNGFSSNTSFVCLTGITINVPQPNSSFVDSAAAGGTTVSATRYCSNTASSLSSGNFGNWTRQTAFVTNGKLKGLYNSYGYKTLASSLAGEAYTQVKGQVFNDTTAPVNDYTKDEKWGISFFDQTGMNGTLQEMVLINAHYKLTP